MKKVIKKTITGFLFNRIEKMGDEDYNHVGFEDKNKSFGDLLLASVPKIGTQRKARITIEILEDAKDIPNQNNENN
ncbi:MAG: hypothetical protein U9Q72_00880 [Patescibacteria group bacterium]|nr:hypothetical protein [Patescibacteria group bacterium]